MCQNCHEMPYTRPLYNARRYKLWQLPTYTHCPVIGTCLTLDELAKVARQTGLVVEPGKDYQLHSTLVQLADQKNPATKRMQKILDSKYARWVKRYDTLQSSQAQRRFWHDALRSGQVPGAFWALVSHRHTPSGLVDQALGEVHMLSHLQGAANRADLRYTTRLEEEITILRDKLERQQIQHQKNQQQSQCLIAAQEKALHSLRQKIGPSRTDHTKAHQELDALRRKHSLLSRQKEWALKQLRRQHSRIRLLEEKQQQLTEQLQETSLERDALESTIENLLKPHAGTKTQASSPMLDLHGQKLAYVGGRTTLFPRLKSFVEAHNGQLYHHDGGIENSQPELCQCLSRADLVFCPVDCVSHNACLQVKKFCKHHSKRFIPLRSASLATFTHQLKQACETPTEWHTHSPP